VSKQGGLLLKPVRFLRSKRRHLVLALLLAIGGISGRAYSDASVDGTTIPGVDQIVDSNGTVWTVSNGYSYENGVPDGGGDITLLLFYNGNIYANTTYYGWWEYLSSGWSPVSGDPRGAFTPQKIVSVCPSGCDYTRISDAANSAQDYELIQVMAGTYADCAVLPSTAPHIWLQGVGGMAQLNGVVCESKGALVTEGTQTVVDNFEFMNLQISCSEGMNATGIRVDAGSLLVRNSYFHDSQGSILTGDDPSASIVVQNSVFERLGVDIDFSCASTGPWFHNIYVSGYGYFTVTNSIFRQNPTGNIIKTRALQSVIQCNQVTNGYDSNYAKTGFLIDLPNGGDEQVDYNILAAGPYTLNQHMVEYGAEGVINPVSALEMTGNILIDDYSSETFLGMWGATTSPAQLMYNTFVGPGYIGDPFAGLVTETGDQWFASRASAGLPPEGLPAMPAACTGPIGLVPVP